MKTTKIFDFPLFEQKKKNNTSVCSKKKQEMFEKYIPPPPSEKFARVAYKTRHCTPSEVTTASRKVISMQMVHKILSGRC